MCKFVIMGMYTHNVYIQSVHILREGGPRLCTHRYFTHFLSTFPDFFVIGSGVYIYRPTCSIHLGYQAKQGTGCLYVCVCVCVCVLTFPSRSRAVLHVFLAFLWYGPLLNHPFFFSRERERCCGSRTLPNTSSM